MTDDHIDVLLFALHRQAQVAPYSGLPMWRSPEDREQLRDVVRKWLAEQKRDER